MNQEEFNEELKKRGVRSFWEPETIPSSPYYRMFWLLTDDDCSGEINVSIEALYKVKDPLKYVLNHVDIVLRNIEDNKE